MTCLFLLLITLPLVLLVGFAAGVYVEVKPILPSWVPGWALRLARGIREWAQS